MLHAQHIKQLQTGSLMLQCPVEANVINYITQQFTLQNGTSES